MGLGTERSSEKAIGVFREALTGGVSQARKPLIDLIPGGKGWGNTEAQRQQSLAEARTLLARMEQSLSVESPPNTALN